MLIALLLILHLALPNAALTPGELALDEHRQPLTRQYICSVKWGLDARHVTDLMKHHVAEAYGIPWIDHDKYEFDHLIPRSMGGADSEANLWPQPWAAAHDKDALEVRLGKLVCNLQVGLVPAQTAISTDWVYAAQKWPRKAKPKKER